MPYGQNTQTPNFANAVGQTPAERWRFSTLNDMMLSINLAGIDYNDSIYDTMEGQQAMRVLTDVMYEIESEGWEFNTFSNMIIDLDNDGKFTFDYAVSPFVFSLVGQQDELFVSGDGTLKTKDRTPGNMDGTIIGKPNASITLNQVIIEAWADMHHALSQYVAAVAINRYQALMIGSVSTAKYTQQDLAVKYGMARRDEIRSGKYNILNSSFGQEVNR